jgi:hypothetical protein
MQYELRMNDQLTSWGLINRNDSESVSNTGGSKQNSSSNDVVATNYKGSRDVQVPPGRNPNGPVMVFMTGFESRGAYGCEEQWNTGDTRV